MPGIACDLCGQEIGSIPVHLKDKGHYHQNCALYEQYPTKDDYLRSLVDDY